MTTYLITSVTGSPGVSTLVAAWASTATTPILAVETDPTGGSDVLAGLFKGQIPPDQGLSVLARTDPGMLREELWHQSLEVPGTGSGRIIPAVATPLQARALANMWPAIAGALRESTQQAGTDLVIDFGRLGHRYAAASLLEIADVIVVLTPGTLAAINATARTLDVLRDEITRSTTSERIIVAPVLPDTTARLRRNAGTTARPYGADEVRAAMKPTRTLDALAYDPDGAAFYSAGATAKRPPKGYNASVARLVAAASEHAARMSDLTSGITQGAGS